MDVEAAPGAAICFGSGDGGDGRDGWLVNVRRGGLERGKGGEGGGAGGGEEGGEDSVL